MNCKNKSFMTKRKAFTLIELLIVIAIIGILFIVLVSKVDFATDKAKATGVQTDFRSFQLAFDTVAKENAGFNTFGWDTGDLNQDGIRNSYDEGDNGAGGGISQNGIQDGTEVFTGHKVYSETFTKVYSLKKAKADGTLETSYDRDALNRLETAINANLDPKLHITIKDDGEIVMANGAKDPWNKEYHGWYITNAEVDKKDRGAIVMYSDGANNEFGSEHSIANGIVTVTVPGSNKAGKDDYSIVSCYTYVNGYGEVLNITAGFSTNQGFLGTNNNNPTIVPGGNNGDAGNNGNAGNNGGNQSGNVSGGNQGTSTPTLTLNEYGFYFNQPYGGREDSLDDFLMFLTFYENGVCTYTDMSGQGMTMNYIVQRWSEFLNDFVQSQGGASEEELKELNEHFASMGVTSNSIALIETNGDEVMPIGVVISKTEIQTFISDCNVYSCDSNDFTVIGEYGYVISKDGSCYYAMVTDRNKTTYSTPKSEVLGKPVILYETYYGCKNLTSITVSSEITEIGKNTFDGCTSLTEINIQNGITKIDENAFEGCTSLQTINIPSSVKEIASSAFYGCTNLSSVVISEGMEYIGATAFAQCTHIESVIIPSTVTYIAPEAFKNCNSLTSITFNGTLEQWEDCIQGQYWNYNVPATYVQCSDGVVNLK